MSDTPRTDQWEQVIPAPDGDDQKIVSSGFARQLERELAAAKAEEWKKEAHDNCVRWTKELGFRDGAFVEVVNRFVSIKEQLGVAERTVLRQGEVIDELTKDRDALREQLGDLLDEMEEQLLK